MLARFVAAASLLALSLSLQAQPGAAPSKAGKPWKIGLIGPMPPAEPLWPRLRELGYVEGAHYVVVHFQPGPDLQARLAALGSQPDAAIDLFIAITSPAALAARTVAPSTPVVAWVHDALKSGLVTSMARPGGNITGFDSRAPEYVAKRVELIMTLLPHARRVGVLHGVGDDSAKFHLDTLQQAAAPRGLAIVALPVRSRDDVGPALQAASVGGLDAVIVVTDFVTQGMVPQILAELRSRNLPSLCEFKLFVALGCTVSYGSTIAEFAAVGARQIDRILRGAKAGDVPMEFPTRYELVLGLKHLNQLGIKVPQELRLRADEVIE